MNTKQRIIIGAVIIFGIFLRCHEYFEDHSLWFDEANIAYKLTHLPLDKIIQDERGITGSLQPLPLGFIYVTKVAIYLSGNHEFSLRFFPLVCGSAAIVLFFLVARKLVPVNWAVLALFFFCVSRDLIYYSSELKPYSSDVLISLGIVLMFLKWETLKEDRRWAAIISVLGALAVWFSFISVFMLFAVGTSFMLLSVAQKDWKALRRLSLMAGFWSLSFLLYYLYSLRFYTGDPALSEYWRYFFLTGQGGGADIIQWSVAAFKRFFNANMQMPAGLAGFFALMGSAALFHKDKYKALAVASPIFLSFLLAVGHVYPFGGRVVTFLIPFFIILLVAGIKETCTRFEKGVAPALALAASAMLLFFPLTATARQFIEPSGIGEIKPVMAYIRERIRPGDVIAVYYGALPSYRYYYERYGFDNVPILTIVKRHIFDMAEGGAGREEIKKYERVWALFSDVSYYENMNKRKVILRWLDERGERVDEFKVPVLPHAHGRTVEANVSASVYLYELNGKKT